MLHKTSNSSPARICGSIGVLAGLFGMQISGASEISVVGPVESISCHARSVRVLGVTFQSDDAALHQEICSLGTPEELIYVAMTGEKIGEAGVQAQRLRLISKGLYVPGATPVYLRAEITSSKPETAQLVLDGATVTGAYGVLQVGSQIELLGTQPVLGGTVLATSIHSVFAQKQSSTGSGKLSSTGSGVRTEAIFEMGSSSTLASLSTIGSESFSSTGSGTLSSTGSGIQSAILTERLSSTGSGKLSSTGSGKLSSTGSGTLSSTGSGYLSFE